MKIRYAEFELDYDQNLSDKKKYIYRYLSVKKNLSFQCRQNWSIVSHQWAIYLLDDSQKGKITNIFMVMQKKCVLFNFILFLSVRKLVDTVSYQDNLICDLNCYFKPLKMKKTNKDAKYVSLKNNILTKLLEHPAIKT